jgi:hypothetical protein
LAGCLVGAGCAGFAGSAGFAGCAGFAGSAGLAGSVGVGLGSSFLQAENPADIAAASTKIPIPEISFFMSITPVTLKYLFWSFVFETSDKVPIPFLPA